MPCRIQFVSGFNLPLHYIVDYQSGDKSNLAPNTNVEIYNSLSLRFNTPLPDSIYLFMYTFNTGNLSGDKSKPAMNTYEYIADGPDCGHWIPTYIAVAGWMISGLSHCYWMTSIANKKGMVRIHMIFGFRKGRF